jgi:hypothetical protein
MVHGQRYRKIPDKKQYEELAKSVLFVHPVLFVPVQGTTERNSGKAIATRWLILIPRRLVAPAVLASSS